MSRFRFRVWNRDHWVDDPRIEVARLHPAPGVMSLVHFDGVIEQWTGLKDRDGRDIYEGDIVQERWKAPAGQMEQTCVIRHGHHEDGDGFQVIGFYGDYTLNPQVVEGASGATLSPSTDRTRVIGNVHEHPHLLKI